MDLAEDEEKQRVFYGHVRETIISLLLMLGLYLTSYSIVAKYQRQRSKEECYSGDDDVMVYRITTWLCSFALCVSIGSALLLPVSVVSNEVLVYYPHSNYMQWLNTSLIRGLWNQVFLACNLSLFVLLPFAYFFMESEGLAGSRKGLMPRVYETVILLSLLAILAIGLAGLLLALLSEEHWAPQWWPATLPFLYSLTSMLGVLLMAVCTPLGSSRLFTVLGTLITSPQLHSRVEEELEQLRLEELTLQRRQRLALNGVTAAGEKEEERNGKRAEDLGNKRKELEHHWHSSKWVRSVLYPLTFLSLLSITTLSLLLVASNCLSLLLGFSDVLPGNTVQDYFLGNESTSPYLGVLGTLLEVIVLIYFVFASVVGFYSTPLLRRLSPALHNTPITKIIANCIVLLVLSSALPLMAKTLGVTRFNLLGRFASIEWLGNFWLVLAYNLLFSSVTAAILFKKMTSQLVHEASSLLGASLRIKLPLTNGRSPGKVSPLKDVHVD